MRWIANMFGKKERPVPLGPEPRLKQKSLKEFNTAPGNNKGGVKIMDMLDVDHVILERGDFYDKEG